MGFIGFLLIMVIPWFICSWLGYRLVRADYRRENLGWSKGDRYSWLIAHLLFGPLALFISFIVFPPHDYFEQDSNW